MLYIETWKRVLVWMVCAAGLVFAAPNLFYGRVELHNDAVKAIEARGSTPELERCRQLGYGTHTQTRRPKVALFVIRGVTRGGRCDTSTSQRKQGCFSQ